MPTVAIFKVWCGDWPIKGFVNIYIYPFKVVYQYRDVPDVCRAVRNSLHCCVEFMGFSIKPFTFFSLCCCVEFMGFFQQKKLSLSFHCVAVLSLGDVRTTISITTKSDSHGSVVYEVWELFFPNPIKHSTRLQFLVDSSLSVYKRRLLELPFKISIFVHFWDFFC